MPGRFDVVLSHLEVGGRPLREVGLTGTRRGVPIGEAPVFVLIGGITADDDPLGDDGQPGWWTALALPGRLDLTAHTVLAPALFGKGSRFDGLHGDEALPAWSAAELADGVAAWLDGIGVRRPVRVIGASLGGLVALALAQRHPAKVETVVTVSAGARPDGWGTGLRHLQREVVRTASARGEVREGMSLARQLGMLTYRGRTELDERFPPQRADEAAPEIARYLDHHGRRFAERFDPRAFLLLSGAIDRLAFGADRAQIRAALSVITARVVVVGVPDDLLFPFRLQKELYEDLRRAGVDAALRTLSSRYGHDAFLADQEALAGLIEDAGVFRVDPPSVAVEVHAVAEAAPVRTLRIGLVGCGVVGQALLALLEARADGLAERYGLRFEVVGIAVRDLRRDRGESAHGIPCTTDPLVLVRDPLVDVIVEVAGSVGPMLPVVSAALSAGKPVVTANKALLATHLGELSALSRAHGAPLVCEAAAAAAIPVLRTLARQVDRPRRLLGIVNGTCNYLLTRMEEGVAASDALRLAQERGFAEADPTADLDGHDAAAKLSLLAYRAFGAWVQPDAFLVRGLREVETADLELAELLGHRLRLIAGAEAVDGGLVLGVEPLALPAWHLLAGVEEEYNAVYLEGDAAGDLGFFGRGAGGPPTATAVLADLVDLGLGTAVGWPVPRAAPLRPLEVLPRRHLLRLDGDGAGGTRRRAEALLRRAGLVVRAFAALRGRQAGRTAWMLDDATPSLVADVAERLRELPGVTRVVTYGVVA